MADTVSQQSGNVISMTCSYCLTEYATPRGRVEAKRRQGQKDFYCSQRCYINAQKSRSDPFRKVLVKNWV